MQSYCMIRPATLKPTPVQTWLKDVVGVMLTEYVSAAYHLLKYLLFAHQARRQMMKKYQV
ncbi:hypothetical protein [Campylobacter californiensis]|uniref:hypothetical protein n=1 Tax=Campylobacter californiensis TaxID=1032243 RepID=UPI001D1514BC|nr:hypothetical protein [Campylobacter sp. RM13119]